MTMRTILTFRRGFTVAGLFATLLLAACGGATGEGNTLASIRITDFALQRPAGALDVPSCIPTQLRAIGTFDDGSLEDLTRRAQWISDTPNVVRIGNSSNDKGVASPIGAVNTTATIRAEFVGLSSTLGVRVSPSQIDITASTPRLAAGTTQQLFADALIGDPGDQGVVSINTGVLWTSSKPEVAAVDAVGFVTVVDTAANDSVIITASTDIPECGAGTAGQTNYPLTIRTAALQALRLVFDGCTEAGCPVRLPINVTRILRLLGDFGSAPASIEFVQDLTGQGSLLFTAADAQVGLFGSRGRNALTSVAAGSTAARAAFTAGRFNGQFDETTLTVNSDVLSVLTVAPSPAKMISGTILPFSASGRFGSADVDLTRDVTWFTPSTTDAEDQVFVDNSLGFQGLTFAPETSDVTTSVGAFRSGFDRNADGIVDENDAVAAPLTTAAQIASLSISQPANQVAECNQSGTIPSAVSCQLKATATLTGGGTQDVTRSVVWTSSDRNIATASNALLLVGQVTGIDDGAPPNTATITARFNAVSATFPVTVQQPAPQADSDGDGVVDTQDQCPNTAAGTPVNAMGCPFAPADGDGDGVTDASDNCPTVVNANQLNTDGAADGGDACDSDDDNDGDPDGADNCPLAANADQLNTDGDAQGNVCDLDDDNDGVADTTDQCPLVPPGAVPAGPTRPGCPCTTPIGAVCLVP